MTEIIRKTRLTDINDIYKIELAQSSSPWKKEHFVDEISNDLSYFFVIENYISNEIIGFIIFWIIDDIAELHSVAISDIYKRSGNGLSLINNMFELLKKKKIREIFLEVRASNIPAINLYKKLEFKEINIRNNYYKSPPEDALVFRKSLIK